MAATHAADARALIERMSEAPVAGDDARAAAAVSALQERAKSDADLAPLAAALGHPRAAALLAGIFSGSPFLSGLIDRDLVRLQRILTTAPEARMQELKAELADELSARRGARRRHARAAPVQERGGVADRARRPRRRLAGADGDRRADRVRRRRAQRRRRLPLPRGGGARPVAARGRRPRRAPRLHRPRHGQVRLGRAQLFERHRPHRLLRARADPHRAGDRAAGLLRAPDARPRATDVGAHRRRLRVPHRPAAAPGCRRHADRPVDHGGAHLLRELRAELGARGAHQGARLRRRHRRGRGAAGRAGAVHLAQVSRLCGHRRRACDEAADFRPSRLRAHRRCRPQHQARARRHPRDRVLRADAAAHRRRTPGGAALATHARRLGEARRARMDQAERRHRAERSLSLFALHRASPANGGRRADARGAGRSGGARTFRPLLRLSRHAGVFRAR